MQVALLPLCALIATPDITSMVEIAQPAQSPTVMPAQQLTLVISATLDTSQLERIAPPAWQDVILAQAL